MDLSVGESATIDSLLLELAAKQATVDALMKGFQPVDFPIVDGLVFDVLYQPAATIEQLGGDWYDIFTLPDGRVAFTLGDVCGRGLAAAVKMGQAKQAIKVAASLSTNDPMPLAVLTQTNRVIFINDHDVKFTTAIYGLIDTENRKVTYASAGHHPPILAKAGREPLVLPNHGFPLGVEVELPDLIREHEFIYERGSLLILYTDGLIEFSHDADDGEARLMKAARDAIESKTPCPARFIVESVLRKEPQYPDDVAVMTIFFE
jgi:serine phosphatase RsbU (regulator of sigma subunit)